jgi:hypothetical protein
MTDESAFTHSTEPDGLDLPPPPAPAAMHPSPYRGCTAAAFADINRALATRSLRSSVYVSPAASNVARPVLYPQSPPSSPDPPLTTPTGVSVNQRKTQPVSKPTYFVRARSLPAHVKTWSHTDDEEDEATPKRRGGMKPWSPLRSQRAPSTARKLEAQFHQAGHESSSSRSRSSDDVRVETKHLAKPSRKRSATTGCVMM